MTISNHHRSGRGGSAAMGALLASTVLAGAPLATAQTQPASGATQVGELVVTAQRRSESIQRVAMSIQALDTKKLEQLDVTEFQDYVKYLPSVSLQTAGPNQTQIYFRGVSDGDNANHSGPLPSVGVYLDEQPITTIGGTLDVHIYDVARVEALAGPQGTLYGASSEAGTLRIITNKPSTAGFSGAVDVQGNTVAHGDEGYVAEGYVNIPLASNIAVRIVGWDQHDAGFINNVEGTRTFPTSAGIYGVPAATVDNAALVKKHFNPADTYGARAALKIDLDENWSIMPTVIAQDQRNTGVFGYEPNVGYLQVQRFQPDTDHDKWLQAALTVTGKLSKMDVTYSGGYFVRSQDTRSDYADYSIFYDQVHGYGAYWTDNNNNPLQKPLQSITGRDRFTKQSHELRIASPSSDRFRVIMGLFTQRQSHWIIQDYQIAGLGDSASIPGWPNTIWLTDQMRIDRDNAVYGEFAYDLTDHLTVTGGVRYYNFDNSLKGFFGLNSHLADCISSAPYRGAPCADLDKEVKGNGETHKINATYKFDGQRLVYFTYATGYRPGGVNRNGDFGPYGADYLTSYEVGWKTSWFNHHLRFNGAIYDEQWDNFQFSFLGQNSLTIIQNAGQAEIKGVESDFSWSVNNNLTFSGSGAYNDAKLTAPYCEDRTITCTNSVADAPSGAQLPVTPKFKGNLIGRYTFDVLGWQSHAQAAVVYTDKVLPGLRTADNYGTSLANNDIASSGLGIMPSYTTADFSIGGERDGLTVELFIKNAFDAHGDLSKYTSCTIIVCTAKATSGANGTTGYPIPQPPAVYIVPIQPRTIGIKIGKKF